MRRVAALVLLLLAAVCALRAEGKHEFRGAWIQTIFQGYEKRSTSQNKEYLTGLLDDLQAAGINAVIFQVRPRADAFYRSEIEPWSQFLTGAIGKAPSPAWDPLEFMVEEAHARGMELHAWLNPYRAPLVSEKAGLPKNHLLRRHPERFIRYGKLYYFDPAQKANREHICKVVRDIATRYDIDGIHFDDYFYPYPIAGKEFPDAAAWRSSGSKLSRDDWRRRNVDLLIEEVAATIAEVKPWLRFGISPFGIWRNAASDPTGSATRGLQGYDDLYADTPLWAARGWIDYQIPQLYWPLDHKAAPYRELAPWWERQKRGRHIYIGQDAEKTAELGELDEKMALAAGAEGACWWYAASLPRLSNSLKGRHYASPALVPEYLWKSVDPAPRPEGLKAKGRHMTWEAAPEARKWVVYRFDSKKDINLENPAAICGVTYSAEFDAPGPGVYAVTALDPANSESSPSVIIIK